MKFWQKIDLAIALPTVIIYILGLTILLSLAPQLFNAQMIFGLAGILVFIAFSQIDYKIFSTFSTFLYLGSLLSLIVTFILGQITRGSTRWIDLGFFRLQPSELIKPFLIIFAVSSLLKRDLKLVSFIFFSLLFFIPLLIVLKQPDLGNAIVYFSFWWMILFMSSYKQFLILLISGCGILLFPFLWRFLESYQKNRIISFLNPSADPLGTGYNAIQAMVAVGSGGLFGRGLGHGTQSHLLFLPEFHTDFIFASFSEEFGLIGVSILLFLYLFLLLRILRIAKKAPDKCGFLIGVGVLMVIFAQCFINIGMNMGILPITGITLPLVSYGGSSLISTAMLLGIASNISQHSRAEDVLTIR